LKTEKIYLVAAACLVASSVHAAEPTTQQFDDVVVSATRGEKSIADAPGSISIVTADEIKKRNITTVDQAFTLLPGVMVDNRKGAMSTSTTVTMRGLPGQNRTLIMLDGIPLNDANTSAVAYSGLYAEDLQKIEVVRGPSSSLYGGAAMGGVVNMISSMPKKREFSLSGGYGDGHPRSEGISHLWTTHASYGDKVGKLRLFAALGYKSVDGFPSNLVVTSSNPATAGLTGWSPTTDNKGAKRYLIGDTGSNGVWDYNAAFRAQYDFSDTTNLRFSFLRNSFRTRYIEPHTYLTNAAGTPVYTYGSVTESNYLTGDYFQAHNTFSLSGEALLGSVKSKVTLGMKDVESWYLTPTTGSTGAKLAGGPGRRTYTPNTSYFADAQFSLPILEKHLLTAGVSYRYDTYDNKDMSVTNWKDENTETGDRNSWAGGTNSNYAAFMQAEIALLDNLTLYAGIRDDYWVTSDGYAGQTAAVAFSSSYPERSQNSISPKGALVWKPLDSTTVRFSGGKAFRAPTISNMYRRSVSVSGGVTTVTDKNLDLKPETVLSWDAGVEQTLWQGAKAKATYFENYLNDMIYLIKKSVTATDVYQQQTNIGGAQNRGVELEMEQRFGKDVRLFAAYTYTDSFITSYDPNPALVGKSLTQTPRHMISGGVDAAYGQLSAMLTGRYLSKRYGSDDNSDVANVYTGYDAYFIADLKTSFKFNKWATVSLSVDNLLDRKYYAYYPGPGRSWFTELALKF